jgi:outer membrane protein assembly factor BamB
LQLRWSADLGDGIVGSPVVSRAGIHASVTVGPNLDLASYSPGGQLRWRQRLWTDPGLGLMTSFSDAWVMDDRVGAGFYYYSLHSGQGGDVPTFNIETGATQGSIGSGVVVGMRGHRLVTRAVAFCGPLCQTTTYRLHDVDTGQSIIVGGGTTIGNQRLYAGARAYPLSGGTTPLWTAAISDVTSAPVLDAGESTVYVVGGSTLYAVNAATGAVLWSADLGAPATTPALAEGVLYVQTTDGRLVALPAAGCGISTCTALWERSTGAARSTTTQPAVGGDVVYTGWSDGSLFAFDRDGNQRWSGSAGSQPITGGPVVSGGQLYAATADGVLSAFGLT